METAKNRPDKVRQRTLLRKRKRRRRSIAAALMVLMLTAALILIINLFFRINEIKVENSISSVYTGEQIIAASGIEKGKNIFSLKKDDVARRLLDTLPYLGKVVVERSLPGTVVLKVSETTDYAGIPYRGGYLIVSSNMKILSDTFVAPVDMPIVYGLTPTNFIPGAALEADNPGSVEALNALMEQLDRYGWFNKVTAINVRDKLDVSAVYEDRIFIKLGSIARLDYKFELLNEVMRNNLDDDFTGNINLSTDKYAYTTEGEMIFPAGYFDIGVAG